MEMFLMVAALSLIGVAVSALLFSAVMEQGEPASPRPVVTPVSPAQFFADTGSLDSRRVPIEALLLQIERHVRLERAVGESFLHAPTAESLQSRTASTLVH